MRDEQKTSRGRLNTFQKTMLHWNDLQPYNAVHVVRIPAHLDFHRLENIIRRVLAAQGLGEIQIDRNQGTYRFAAGEIRCEIEQIAGTDGTFGLLSAAIERQLNTAFPSGTVFLPFRFFVAAGTDFFSFGLVYFHPVADAESIVLLVKDIVAAYLSAGEAPVVAAFDLYPPRKDRLLTHGPMLLAKRIAALPSARRQRKTANRPPYLDVNDFNVGFTFLSLGSDRLQALIATAKAWGVTVNDLFLALLLKCLSPLATERTRHPKRRSISIGSIVNLRRDLALPNPRTFGLFLGSFAVAHEVPANISLQDLARDVSAQTRAVKTKRLCLGSPLELLIGNFVFSFFSLEYRRKLYQKHYPLWGGITNMNLNPLWPQSGAGEPTHYFRAVSTGPATPLVLSVTTAGETLNVGISYRKTVFSGQSIVRIKRDFLELLKQLHGVA